MTVEDMFRYERDRMNFRGHEFVWYSTYHGRVEPCWILVFTRNFRMSGEVLYLGK